MCVCLWVGVRVKERERERERVCVCVFYVFSIYICMYVMVCRDNNTHIHTCLFDAFLKSGLMDSEVRSESLRDLRTRGFNVIGFWG